MASKHLSEDEIKYVISADSSKAQQELHSLGKSTAQLRREESARRKAMIELEATGQKNSAQYKRLSEECKSYSKQIKDNEDKMRKLRSSLDVTTMTMSQLRKQSKELQRELDNVSKSLNPGEYKKLEDQLSHVNGRIAELRQNAKSFTELAASDGVNNFFYGQVGYKALELFGSKLRKLRDSVRELTNEGVEMARSADGITHAFSQFGNPELLNQLRTATKGAVGDIELMKAAVKAKDFRIPLEDLGKYLSFAQLKAQQTGQSLDYMVDSIVTGLGRQSPMILDNLGLSAAEISEKTKETGDFMRGVASIVEKSLSEAGPRYISAADRAAQAAVRLQNKQYEVGKALLEYDELVEGVYGRIKIGLLDIIKFFAQHRTATISLTVAMVGLVVSMTALNTSFKAFISNMALSKAFVAGWATITSTFKGLQLLFIAITSSTTRANAAMRLFNATCKANVMMLLATAIAAAAVAIGTYIARTSKADVITKRLEETQKRLASMSSNVSKQIVSDQLSIKKAVNDSVTSQKSKIDMLTKTINDNTETNAKRIKALDELKRIIPSYHAQLTTEGKLINNNTSAIKEYTKNLMKAAMAQAMIGKIGSITGNQLNHSLLLENRKGNRNYAINKLRALGMNEDREVRTFDIHASRGGDVFMKTGIFDKKTGKLIQEISRDTEEQILAFQKLVLYNDKRIEEETMYISNDNARIEAIRKLAKQQQIDLEEKTMQKETPNSSDAKKVKKEKKGKDPDDIATKQFSHDRSQDLEEAKQSYNQDLNALKQSLAEKKLTQEQYNAYVGALNIQHQNNLLAIEQSYQARSQNLAIKDAAKKQALQESQDKAVADQQQAAANAFIENEEQFYDALEKMEDMRKASAPQTLQQELDTKLLALDGYYKASLQLAEGDGEKQKQVTIAYEAAKAQITAEYAKKAAEDKEQARQAYGLNTFEDELAARRKKIDEDYAKSVLTEQQHQQALTNLDQQAEEHRLQIRQQYGLVTQQELYNAELAQLKQHLQNKEISETEYEEAIKNLKIAKAKEAFDYYANLTSGAMQALMQAEEANVDAKYDAEIEAARNAGKDTTEIEKKKANEKLKIQKKYADINFAIQAAQIIASTAAAIAKTFADLGFPAGIPAAVLMSVTGTAQLAAALAERNKVKKMTMQGDSAATASGSRVATGLESGGSIDIEREQDERLFHAAYDPSRRGFVEKPTVIVGEGPYGHSREWVASNAAVENPTIAPIIDIIDRAQRAGTIRTLDMNKFLLQQAQGKAEGGTINSVSNPTQPLSNGSYRDSLIERLANVLNRLADDGISAAVTLDDIERKQHLRDRARKFGSK